MAALIVASLLWAVVIIPAHAQFNMWPTINSTWLASAMGLSTACLDALSVFLMPNFVMSAAN